jgi:flagellar biosynthesis protein FlhG
VLIIDTGAGVNSNIVSLCQAADHVLVIATPEPTSITDAYAMVKSIAGSNKAGTTNVRKISLLANQVSSSAEGRAVHDRVARVARQFIGVSVLDAGHIVSDEEMTRAVRKRTPLVLHAPTAPASRCLSQLAMRLEPGLMSEVTGNQDRADVRETSPSFFKRLATKLKGGA